MQVKVVHFPLHPDTPQEGKSLEALFAGRGYDIPKMQAQMRARMAAEGLPYGDRKMTFNSRLAQELGKLGGRRSPAAKRSTMRSSGPTSSTGRTSATPTCWCRSPGSVGLPGDKAREVIGSARTSAAIDADWAKSREYGVTGVPTFVAGEQGVVGAQPYEALEELVK